MILENLKFIYQNISGTSSINTDTNDISSNEIDDKLYSGFKLPIHYISKDHVHPLSNIVSADLELLKDERIDISCNTSEIIEPKQCMYDHIFNPQHSFAHDMISEWNKYYTTNIPFLLDSQRMIKNTGEYIESMQNNSFTQDNCDTILEIWKDTKEENNFLEKYCYIEWDMFKHFNESSYFLQFLTIINMTSPILSLIIPIVFFIFPFLLLKIRGIPITFTMYTQILQDIARHHFIGKTIGAFQSMSWDKIVYVMITIALYFVQIYQNVNLCIRFYKNIHRINTHLSEMKQYVSYSINSIDSFSNINSNLENYNEFCKISSHHSSVLKKLYQELNSIQPFKPSILKFSEIGYLLRCFYRLHSNEEYEKSIRYSIGFEGFIDNIKGIYKQLQHKHIAIAQFDNASSTYFGKQYYPPYVNKKHVKNDIDLSNNSIITGPNASGKTTMLKTTTINIIFTQQFGCGFYDKCNIRPYTHIHSYLNIPDTSGRDSLFQAESRRCKEIIDIIKDNGDKSRHFCIFDELYSGTNPVEATQAAYAFLLYLSKHQNVDFILTTHYVELCKKLDRKINRKITDKPSEKGNIPKMLQNYKMNIIKNPDTGSIKYTYLMKPGISKIKGAILILQEMEYPQEIIQEMRKYKKI